MSEQYTIRFWQDDEYELIDSHTSEQVMVGTLQEINAYLELKAKGFEI